MLKDNPDSRAADTDAWSKFARAWAMLGPPLRPCEKDIEVVATAVASWSEGRGAPRALILGVTPELYHLPWPAGTDLVAVDHNQGMIDQVWPGPRDAAICADWTAMPLPDGSRDIAICDGGLTLLSHPDGQFGMVKSLGRVIAGDGLFAVRLFAPASPGEDPDDVLRDLLDGKVKDFNSLKLRLWTALQKDLPTGILMHDFWSAVHSVAPDLDKLAEQIGWEPDHLRVINIHRNNPARYRFPTADEVEQLYSKEPGGFSLESVTTPSYDLGDQCPTMVFRRV
jgi:hypothetical protein